MQEKDSSVEIFRSSRVRSGGCSSLGIDAWSILVNRSTETKRGRGRGVSGQTIGVLGRAGGRH
jgi:hypothetical protein